MKYNIRYIIVVNQGVLRYDLEWEELFDRRSTSGHLSWSEKSEKKKHWHRF